MNPTIQTLLLALVLGGAAAAQTQNENSLFGGNSIVQVDDRTDQTDNQIGDESGDSLFSRDSLVNDVGVSTAGGNAATTTDPSAALLEGGTTVGGSFEFSLEGTLELSPEGEFGFRSGTTELQTRLFVDARPQSDFRVLASGNLGYSTAQGGLFSLHELFADVELDTVFVRAGKQTVNWGVGYFYSPANLINVERIDPENPGEELSGPAALRAQLPIGNDNLTGYVLTDDFGDELNLNAAARYETLLSGFEVTTGGVARDDGAWAVMGTATGGVAGVTVFGEAVLEGNTNKVFVLEDAAAPLGLSTTQSENLFFSGTFGGRYTFETDDDLFSLTATAQYFFNGQGYADPGVITDNPSAVAGLIESGELSQNDLAERGQHYLGVNAAATEFYDSDFTPSVLWLANIGDSSGLVNVGVNYALNDFFTPRLEYSFRYGAAGSEYNPAGQQHSLVVALDVSGTF